MKWQLQESLKQKRAGETVVRTGVSGAATVSFALVFPNQYHLGMSNLGFQIIFREINSRQDTLCERAFLPSAAELLEHKRTGAPLMTIESQREVNRFDLIGFAISFELDYFNVLELLQLAKIPLKSHERRQTDPIIVAGGPCATFNPEPLADTIDVFVIGEGEETIQDLLGCYQHSKNNGKTRDDILQELSRIPGVYVPQYYVPDQRIVRRWVHDLDRFSGESSILADNTAFESMYLFEIARGCGRHCRFCMAGYCFRPPRSRSLEPIRQAIEQAKLHHKRIGLVGAAVSDFPDMELLCSVLQESGTPASVASLRADSTTAELVDLLVASGHKTITLAPEAGSERLRRVINKGITETDILNTISLAVTAGIPHVKLYLMIGLPTETTEDIEAIHDLALKVRDCMQSGKKNGLLTLSVNPFIPKPFTPFQWLPMLEPKLLESRLHELEKSLKGQKRIKIQVESLREAYLQGLLSRGDRSVGEVLHLAFNSGGWKYWRQAMKQLNLTEVNYLFRLRQKNEEFPWDRIDVGVSREYLWQEYQRSLHETTTAECTEGCRRCGVCAE